MAGVGSQLCQLHPSVLGHGTSRGSYGGGVGETGKMGYLERSCDRCLPAGMETFLNFRDDIASLCVLVRADTVGFPSGSLKFSKVSLLQIPSTST